ncbi:MAG: hypothetical protein HKN39_02055 [Flavobacteriales bacterium]|nr:hypothetical protein [Flavobacteriales bacterium]
MKNRIKKKRILFAANDIGWRIEHYSNFIKHNCSEVLVAESFVNYVAPSSLYNTNYTYSFNYSKLPSILRWCLSVFLFFKFLMKYDIFHFFSGETILTRNTRKLEFIVYKLFNKKVIMHFVGADIRNPKYVEWKEQNIQAYLKGDRPPIEPLKWQKKLMEDSQKYADRVLVSTPDLLCIYPGKANYFPVLLDLDKFNMEISKIEFERSNEIVIVHAPSNPLVKGSRIIEPVLKSIKEKYGDKVKLILREDLDNITRYATSRYDLFRCFLVSNIVIDQMVIGWYGLQAIEAVMTDNQVISYVGQDVEKYLFPECPIILANAIDLYEVIEACIKRELNGRIDYKSAKEWVRKYHSIEQNNELLLDTWLN